MESPSSDSPILLGVAQRVQRRGASLDLLGFGSVHGLVVFPAALSLFFLVLRLPSTWFSKPFKCVVRARNSASPDQAAWYEIAVEVSDAPLTVEDSGARKDDFAAREIYEIETPNGNVIIENHRLVLRCPPLTLAAPGAVSLEIERDRETYIAGHFMCTWCEPPPLTQVERRAILSRPGAKRFLGFILQCKTCNDRIQIKEALDPIDREKNTDELGVWTEHVPDPWRCKCGSSSITTKYIKHGLFDLFRRDTGKFETQQLNVVRQYETHALQMLVSEYESLIHSEPSEEAVQLFLERNSILWGFLAPIQILHKPPLLVKYKADFGILTSSRILYLVEIEKPQTRLTKQNGGLHSELQTGLDQLRNWRVVVENQRCAVLDSIGLKTEEIHSVKYMLIAGLARAVPDSALRALRTTPLGVEFYCFDELASLLARFIHQLADI